MSQSARRIGIIMNGVTGRMGSNEHLMRSIVAIIRQGGARAADGELIVPDPILVGRNERKLRDLAERSGAGRFTTDLAAALADPHDEVYFDSQITSLRAAAVRSAVEAGKHVYCEKPAAATSGQARELHELAEAAGVRTGVVQDKLFLPGLLRLKSLLDGGSLGRVLSVRGEFGYWAFEGERVEPQRPSWNYRAADGGGIISDMFCHWQYVLAGLFGRVRAVSCLGATHVERRWDEGGSPYDCTADDAAYATFELEGGIVAQFNSSWATRVRRDDLLTIQVDGTAGSAVAGLTRCWRQLRGETPRYHWDPDVDPHVDYAAAWEPVEPERRFENAFKAQWERFLLHVATGEPFPWTLREGAKGVQLAEKAVESWRRRAWVDVPPI